MSTLDTTTLAPSPTFLFDHALSDRENLLRSGLNLSEEQITHAEQIIERRLARHRVSLARQADKRAGELKAEHAAAISKLTTKDATTPVPAPALDQRQEAAKERELERHWKAYAD